MQTRPLLPGGPEVSELGFGAWAIGGGWGQQFSRPEVDRLLGRAAELGINLIDTAECYGDHLSESLIGQSIRGQRDHWILATKFGHRFTGHLQRDQLWSAEDVRQQLERSLRALQVDTIDLYQFHSGNNAEFDNDALWTMLDKQVQVGRIRYLGISVSSRGDPMHQVNQATAVGAAAIQVVYNRLQREPEEWILPACEEYDLGVLARVPLASGLLSGKYGPGTRFSLEDDVRSSFDVQVVQDQLQEIQHIQETEVPAGVAMAPWALSWCLRHPAVTCVIPGCKSVAQVESNAAAADLASDDHPQAVA